MNNVIWVKSFRTLGILLIISTCCFCRSSKQQAIVELLTEKQCACWDAKIGWGMCLSRDGNLYRYMFANQARSKRIEADYGDVIFGQFKWKIKRDSLIIFSGLYKEGYKIKSLTNQQLVLIDSSRVHLTEELVYTKLTNVSTVDSLKKEIVHPK